MLEKKVIDLEENKRKVMAERAAEKMKEMDLKAQEKKDKEQEKLAREV